MMLLTLAACLFKLERKNKEALLMPNQHSVKASGGVKLNFLILNLCSGCWGGKWSVSCSGHFTRREGAIG